MALESQGTTITYNTPTILGVISIGGPSGSAPVIDVSDLSSTAAAKLMGLLDEGQVVLECNFLPADPGQLACRVARLARTAHEAVIAFSDAANTATFQAFCTGFAVTGGVNAQMKVTITLEVSGAVAYTAV